MKNGTATKKKPICGTAMYYFTSNLVANDLLRPLKNLAEDVG